MTICSIAILYFNIVIIYYTHIYSADNILNITVCNTLNFIHAMFIILNRISENLYKMCMINDNLMRIRTKRP